MNTDLAEENTDEIVHYSAIYCANFSTLDFRHVELFTIKSVTKN